MSNGVVFLARFCVPGWDVNKYLSNTHSHIIIILYNYQNKQALVYYCKVFSRGTRYEALKFLFQRIDSHHS